MDEKASPTPEQEAKARQRAEVIWAVRSGRMTATEGATSLGISRQCYYEWERRALNGMADALLDREAGRPLAKEEDPEKTELKARLARLEREMATLHQKASVREVLYPFAEWQPNPSEPEKKRRKAE